MHRVFDLLDSRVGHRYAALNLVHAGGVVSCVARGFDRQRMSEAWHAAGLQPLDRLTPRLLAQPGTAAALDSDDPELAGAASAPFRAFMRAFDMERMAGIALPVPHTACTALLYTNRSRTDPRFTAAELEWLGHLAAHLTEALLVNRLWHRAGPAPAADAALTCPQGWLLYPDDRFARLWQRWGTMHAELRHPRVPLTWLQAGGAELRDGTQRWMVHVVPLDEGFRIEVVAAGDATVPRLTPRERQVADLYARGFSHKEIGRELGIAPNTVRVHVSRCFDKLQVRSRSELRRQLPQPAAPGSGPP